MYQCHCHPARWLLVMMYFVAQVSIISAWVGATTKWDLSFRRPITSRICSGRQGDMDLDAVTDAQALLACRAYLTKKNSTLWTRYSRRKQRSKQALKSLKEAYNDFNNEGSGFFWEDPSQLIYLGVDDMDDDKRMPFIDDITEMDDEDEEEEAIWETITPFRHMQRIEVQDYYDGQSDGKNDDDPLWEKDIEEQSTSSAVNAEQIQPSSTYVKRSKASRKTWNDPEFRQRWYDRRWGGRTKSPDIKKRERIEERLRRMDPERFLADEALAEMTKENMEEAIATYIQSSQRRSQSRRLQQDISNLEKTDDVRVGTNETQPSSPCFEMDVNGLEEARRKRSERAAKAYQTRLRNQKERSDHDIIKEHNADHALSSISAESTQLITKEESTSQQNVLTQIQSDLDAGRRPSSNDVIIMMKPSKLAGRKEILRRILSECFDLRGKCIPVDSDKHAFVTKCTVEQIGSFVISKLES